MKLKQQSDEQEGPPRKPWRTNKDEKRSELLHRHLHHHHPTVLALYHQRRRILNYLVW